VSPPHKPRKICLAAMSVSAALVLATAGGSAGAEPGPSAHEVAKSKQVVRDRAAAVGRIKARLAMADGELERLADTAEMAMERYNGEYVKLTQADQANQAAQQRLLRAQQSYEQFREQLAAFAGQAYRMETGVNGLSAAVSGDGGPQGFLDRAGMVEVLANRQAGAVERMRAAKVVADLFRGQAQEAVRAQQAATKAAADAKQAAEGAAARQRSEVQRIGQVKAELVKQLGKAQAHAADLGRRRELALEQARAAAAWSRHGGRFAGLLGDSSRGAVAVRAALNWLGTPYSWGGGTDSGPTYGTAQGSGTRGFDCSGLALYAWNRAGVRLDHWTGTQWTSGPHVPPDQLRPGDLVFFASDTGDPHTIHHVGIYIGRGQMVEAPYTGGRVRISSIWRNGFIGATRPAG
jgi:cell wall-associated NlpC family hydrolase